MKKILLDLLECPICHQELDWKIREETDDYIEQAEASCSACDSTYPILDGIGIFLTPDLPRNDLWLETDSQLAQHLASNPEDEKKLLEGPVDELSPTDQQLRAGILDERDDFQEAKRVEELAHQNLYTPSYLDGWESQFNYVLDQLKELDGPIIDLASGRCYLVERIASSLNRPVVATDFSPSVLRRDRRYFQYLKLDHLISFLAFDARKTPFQTDSVPVLTTNIGLPNIEDPGDLMLELRRIVDGTFLAISHFFLNRADENYDLIKTAGIEAFVYKDSAADHFSNAGWKVKFENSCLAEALPTPESEIFEGLRADGLPVVPTQLEWCTIRAE
jgi:uncharacterized protein YbaR (Trm112 family)